MKIWHDRTEREKWLIALGGAILAIVLFWQFIVNPVLTAKQEANSRHITALRDYDIVSQGAPMLQKVNANKALKPFNRAAAIKTAQTVNIPISRVQPTSDGSVQIWFEGSQSGQVFAFLQSLTAEYNVAISRAQISRRDNGLVSAQLTLSPIS